MMNKQKSRKPKQRLPMLLFFVLFIFIIMLISISTSGTVVYMLSKYGVLPPFGERSYSGILLFLMLVSLGVGSLFSAVGGSRFLRPLQNLIDGTKEVSAGNFDIHIEETGIHEIQRLINSFNSMAIELRGIEALQNDFVRNVSHEFKTPVATIQGFVNLLKLDSITAEQRKEYLDIISIETERLIQLSGNVLLLSNLDNTERKPEKTVFSLDEQLRLTVLQFETQLEKKHLNVSINVDTISVMGYEEILKQAWINLLSNAIKFTPTGGAIEIAATSSNGFATVVISDTGIGMTPNVREHLFDRFYQGDASRATQGNGLGLSLVKRILDLCNGKIKVSSTEGEGSVFEVSIPLDIRYL